MRYGPDLADMDAVGVEVKRDFTAEQRRKAHTIPGTDSFPIENEEDLRNAIRAVGRASDPAEARRHIVTQAKRLGKLSMVPDDWEEKSAFVDVEVKRTTTKPWETRKAQRAGDTIGKDKSEDSEGGDEYPLRTIGDIAAAVKRANKIKDPERRKQVRAHIRKGAAKINASNMIPKDWGEKSAVPARAYLLSDDERELLDAIEVKLMSPDPRARRLRAYWARGAGRLKWNTFRELRSELRKYVPPHMLNGLTANIYKLAKGHWPGRHDTFHKGGAPAGIEYKGEVVNELDEPPTITELEALYGDDEEDLDDLDVDDEVDDDEQALFDDAGLEHDDIDALGDDDGADAEKGLWLDRFEVKVMSPNPNAARLRNYWARGKGRAKWRPGTPGDFKRLRRQLKKYVKNPRILNGLTANIHKLATGKWPGPGKGPGRHKGAPEPDETKVMISPDLVAQMRELHDEDDQDVWSAYDEVADKITAEDAYEQALAAEVPWQLDANGELIEVVDDGPVPVADDDVPSLLDDADPPWSSTAPPDLLSLAPE